MFNIEFDVLWLFFGFFAFLFIFINIIKLTTKKRKYWSLFCILSLSFGCLAILSDFHQVLNAVNRNDVAYILDVIPSVKAFITSPVFLGIAANIIIGIINSVLDNNNK